jgi:hypothetical protein
LMVDGVGESAENADRPFSDRNLINTFLIGVCKHQTA